MNKALRRCAGVTVAAIALSMCHSGSAAAQGVLQWVPSTRSWSMGQIGAADAADARNVFFNPAIVASAEGLSVWGDYQSLDIGDLRFYDIGGEYARRLELSEERAIRFGAAFRYDVLDFGEVEVCPNLILPSCPAQRVKDKVYNATAGAELMLNRRVSLGTGFTVKPWRQEYDGTAKFEKTAYDIGLLVRTVILEDENAKISADVGAGWLNLGGDVDLGGGESSPLPRRDRYGVALNYEGPMSGYFQKRFSVDVPVCSVTAEYEYVRNGVESRFERRRAWGVGTEIGFYRILFIRTGFFKPETSNSRNTGVGFGLGWMFRRGWCRFDFASTPNGFESRDRFLYGLSGGFAL